MLMNKNFFTKEDNIMKKFLLLATFVLLAAALFSCAMKYTGNPAAKGNENEPVENPIEEITTELGDKNSANGFLIPTGYPATKFPVRLSGNREIKFDASYRDILNLLKTMDGLKICGYGIAGNFPCICVGFSGEDSGIVLKIDPVYTLININNEYCPSIIAVDSAEKYEEDFSSCTKEEQDSLWKWLENNADRVPTRTYDETPELDRKPHTPEEFYKTLQ